jgi:hypothetical protein
MNSLRDFPMIPPPGIVASAPPKLVSGRSGHDFPEIHREVVTYVTAFFFALD